jgi:hypothetical protein
VNEAKLLYDRQHMLTFIISYDLVGERDYETLFQAIRSYGTFAHIHESLWAVVTEQNAAQVRDYLLRFMDHDDRLIVVESANHAAWRGVLCTQEWLLQHV